MSLQLCSGRHFVKGTPLAKVWRAAKTAVQHGLGHPDLAASRTVGHIVAEPNPLPSDITAPAILRWETNARKAEVYLSRDGAPEKRISRCVCRSYDTTRIRAGSHYLFRLYETTGAPRLLDELTVTRECHGKLRISGTPNPLSFAGRALLEWEITAPALAEVRVSEANSPEKLISAGVSGALRIDWLRPRTNYLFRLYLRAFDRPASEYQLLDELKVQWGDDMTSRQLAEFVAKLVSRCLYDKDFPTWFRLWEEHGFHVTPVHYYSPIPDSQHLDPDIWDRPSELPGIDLNSTMQLYLLHEVFPRFRSEYERIPVDSSLAGYGFYLHNGRFQDTDPLIAYCIVRHFKPRRIVEVGGGYSTLLLEQASKNNGNTELFIIEPYPEDMLHAYGPNLIQKKVEDIDLAFFQSLESGDCLFIDSSHVVKTGGDVNFLFLEVLPRLKPGVLVHIHDIFFPFEYPREWVIEERRFWTEQYLLQAFLSFNFEFEILVSSNYLQTYHSAELERIFPLTKPWQGGSFWMRRKQPRS